MARKLINTKRISHDEWLSLRRKSIGGSDAGAVVGMNQYSSLLTLYADKKGMSKEKETSEAMRLGTDLEAYVAERFTERTGKKVMNDNFMYMDDEYDFITANVDRKVVGENAGLECKTMGSFNGYNLEANEVPAHYYCQCQHYCMVMGYERIYLAILVLQKGLYVVEIERDDDFIKKLREAEITFWKHYIEKGIMPAPDGSDASVETLKELYPEAEKNTEIAIFGLDQMIRDYTAFQELEKQYHEKAEEVKARICAKLGDNETGVGDNYKCTWKNQSRSSVPSAKLKAKYPKIYQELVEVSKYRVFRARPMTEKEK